MALEKDGFAGDGDRFVVQWGGGGGGRGKAQHLGDFRNGDSVGPSLDTFLDFRAKYFFCLIAGYKEFLKK
jgi:hypothetical protein